MAFCVSLDGRGAYASSQLSLTKLKRWSDMNSEIDGLWADHIAQEIIEAVYNPCGHNNDGAYRPALITVRDPVLGAKLQRSATMRGLSCPGTEVRVVNASALVNGTPLVSIMDGLCTNTIPLVNGETRTYLTEEEAREKWGLDDAKVRSSKSDLDKYKLDKESEVRGVPAMVWVCGGCYKLMYETKAKVCQKRHTTAVGRVRSWGEDWWAQGFMQSGSGGGAAGSAHGDAARGSRCIRGRAWTNPVPYGYGPVHVSGVVGLGQKVISCKYG